MIWPFVPTDRRILDLRRKLRGMTAVAAQFRNENARLVDANKTLSQLLDIRREANKRLMATAAEREKVIARLEDELALLREEKARQAETISGLDAEHAQLSGRLATAEERLALVDREEDMRDEIRAKRASDL